MSVTKFFILSSFSIWANLTVMGAGLSVTKFFNAPNVTFSPRRLERMVPSDFWASLVVIGAGLSVTRFFKAPRVTFSPRRDETVSYTHLTLPTSDLV
mgnify:CR=1 FL=1